MEGGDGFFTGESSVQKDDNSVSIKSRNDETSKMDYEFSEAFTPKDILSQSNEEKVEKMINQHAEFRDERKTVLIDEVEIENFEISTTSDLNKQTDFNNIGTKKEDNKNHCNEVSERSTTKPEIIDGHSCNEEMNTSLDTSISHDIDGSYSTNNNLKEELLQSTDCQEKEFCDMSDLAFVTEIVEGTSSNSSELKEVTKSKVERSDHNDLVKIASEKLGKTLYAVEVDSTETEDSSDSSTESSSTESSSSSSSESSDEDRISKLRQSIEFEENEGVHHQAPKTKDEILPEELPEEPEINMELPDEAKIDPVGVVQSFVELMLVIKAFEETPALDAETIFFREDRKPLGRVYDVFGPVQNPFYVIRFDKKDKFENMGIKVGEAVYFAPNFLNFTKYVFVEQLKKLKGSDASWKHDQEPPPECIDYSDDEEEAKAKAATKKKRVNDRKTLEEECLNDADDEEQNHFERKIKKGKQRNFNGTRQMNAGQDGIGSPKPGVRRGTCMNGSNQREFPSSKRPQATQDFQPTRPNVPFGQQSTGNAAFPGNIPRNFHEPAFQPSFASQIRSTIGIRPAGMIDRQTFPNGQPMFYPPPQGTAPSSNFRATLSTGEPLSGKHGRDNEPTRGQAFRPGYIFPPPSGPSWPTFDPSVPPPNFPHGLPPPNMPHMPPPSHFSSSQQWRP